MRSSPYNSSTLRSENAETCSKKVSVPRRAYDFILIFVVKGTVP